MRVSVHQPKREPIEIALMPHPSMQPDFEVKKMAAAGDAFKRSCKRSPVSPAAMQ